MHRQCATSATAMHRQCTCRCLGVQPMELVNAWTGRTACALQRALRLTNEAFADHLGVAVRTVATCFPPIPTVSCDYRLCKSLAGDAKTLDVMKIVSVMGTHKPNLPPFTPANHIFPPILEALEVPNDPANH